MLFILDVSCFSLNEVLEFAEDIAIDIPKFWDYLGEILSPVVVDSSLSLSFLSSVVPSLVCCHFLLSLSI